MSPFHGDDPGSNPGRGAFIKMILWKNHLSELFDDGRGSGKNAGIPQTSHMHSNLKSLIDYCKKDGREWSFAKVECEPSDVELDSNLGPGWYRAIKFIFSKEGFMPLEEAKKKYLKYG